MSRKLVIDLLQLGRNTLLVLTSMVLLLVFIELALRLMGIAENPGLFIPSSKEQPGVLTTNDMYTTRHFSSGLVRFPLKQKFSKEKPEGIIRVFIAGESAALGDPEPAYGFGRMLSLLLEKNYPNRHFEIINTAITAINSHVIKEITRECIQYDADLFIFFMGNNEVIGPYGARSWNNLAWIKTSMFIKRSRLWKLASLVAERVSSRQIKGWGGIDQFADQSVSWDSPSLSRVHDNYEQNLKDIIKYLKRKDIDGWFITVPTNIVDFYPFDSPSVHSDKSAADSQDSLLNIAWQQYVNGQYPASDEIVRDILLADSMHAGSNYLQGKLYLADNKESFATKFLVKAKDLDGLRFRTDSRINDITTNLVSRAGEKFKLIPYAESLLDTSLYMLGKRMFLEHVHFTYEGNFLLAHRLFREIETWLNLSRDTSRVNMDSFRTILAYTVFDEIEILDEVIRRYQNPPFVHRLANTMELEYFIDQRAQLIAEFQKGAGTIDSFYTIALRATHRFDPQVHFKYAKHLIRENNPAATGRAKELILKVIKEYPDHSMAYNLLGVIAEREANLPLAKDNYERSIQFYPRYIEARYNLARLDFYAGDIPSGMQHLEKILSTPLEISTFLTNVSRALIMGSKMTEAKLLLLKSIELDDSNQDARYLLGELYFQEGKQDLALQYFLELNSVNYPNAVVYNQLSNIYYKKSQFEHALMFIEKAISRDSSNAVFYYQKGMILAKKGDLDYSIDNFKQSIKLNPGFEPAYRRIIEILDRQNKTEERDFFARELKSMQGE